MLDPEKRNTLVLRLSGKAELPSELKIGFNYLVHLQGTITALTESDNNDGSHTFYYKFQPILVELITETGETLKLKDARSLSQRLRACFWKDWQDENVNCEFEDFYARLMQELIKEHKQISEMFSPDYK